MEVVQSFGVNPTDPGLGKGISVSEHTFLHVIEVMT